MKSRRSGLKDLILTALIGLSVLCISACSRSGQDRAAPAAETKTEGPAVETTAPPAADKYADWVEYGSEPHLFTVITPKSFEVSRDTTQSAAGEMELVSYLAELGQVAYGVVCSDFPQDFIDKTEPNTLLKNGSKGFINQFNGKVSGEQLLSLDGNPGLEIALTGITQGVDIFAKARFYLVGKRLYQVMVIAEKGKEDLEAIDKFLRSFRLKSHQENS